MLPAGFRLALDPGVRRLDGGTVLVGGSPLRLLRLGATGAALVDRLASGSAVPADAAAQRLARRLLDAGIAHPRPGAGSLGVEDLTVVVPVRDRPEGLRRVLAALGSDLCVVVVDDGSRDPAALALVAGRHGARVVRRAVSGGPAAARNAGLALVDTPVVAFVDSDCRPAAGWLERLLPHLADPQVAAVAPRVRTGGPSLLGRYDAARSSLDLGPREGRVAARTRIGYVPAAALVARTRVLVDLGGFDETLRVGEDVDLVWRLHEAGWTVRYEPAALVRHDERPLLGEWVGRRFAYGTSAASLAQRHPGTLVPVAVSPFSAGAWLLAAAGRPAAGTALAALGWRRLARRLPLPRPWREAARLTLGGTLGAWRPLADATVRAWWPLTLALSTRSRTARRALLAATVGTALADWLHTRPALDPLRYTLLHTLDDAAYGAGVWLGCMRERTLEPLSGVRRSC